MKAQVSNQYPLGRPPKPQIGDRIPVWFPGGTVIAVEPYRGRYKEFFTWDVTVTAARTRSGTFVVCI